MRGYLLYYTADTEGDWLREPVDLRLYPTEAAAQAAWDRAYRGPDPSGAQAYPQIFAVDVDADDLPGQVYVPGLGYVRIEGAVRDAAVECEHSTADVEDDECSCGARCTHAVVQDGTCYDSTCPLHGEQADA